MSASLSDGFGRRIDYLRVSITDRCNLRCFYCIPKGAKGFEAKANWLELDEISRIIRAFVRLGVHNVRITGGEPLVRKGLKDFAAQLAQLPNLRDLSLSTNACYLESKATALKAAGINRINVSLDTLQAERFRQITGGDIEPVLKGLEAARVAGLSPIKINMVVMRGVNDDEVEAMLEYCMANDFALRFIETMPVGEGGRNAVDRYISVDEVRRRLSQKYELLPGLLPGGGPARYARIAGTSQHIGFISPMSQHFCPSCNRVRLTVDGTLLLCLGQEHKLELAPLLRQGISDAELEQTLRDVMLLKPERHEFTEKPEQVIRFMSYSGG